MCVSQLHADCQLFLLLQHSKQNAMELPSPLLIDIRHLLTDCCQTWLSCKCNNDPRTTRPAADAEWSPLWNLHHRVWLQNVRFAEQKCSYLISRSEQKSEGNAMQYGSRQLEWPILHLFLIQILGLNCWAAAPLTTKLYTKTVADLSCSWPAADRRSTFLWLATGNTE